MSIARALVEKHGKIAAVLFPASVLGGFAYSAATGRSPVEETKKWMQGEALVHAVLPPNAISFVPPRGGFCEAARLAARSKYRALERRRLDCESASLSPASSVSLCKPSLQLVTLGMLLGRFYHSCIMVVTSGIYRSLPPSRYTRLCASGCWG